MRGVAEKVVETGFRQETWKHGSSQAHGRPNKLHCFLSTVARLSCTFGFDMVEVRTLGIQELQVPAPDAMQPLNDGVGDHGLELPGVRFGVFLGELVGALPL